MESSQTNLMTSRIGHSYFVQIILISLLLHFVISNEVLTNNFDSIDAVNVDISNQVLQQDIHSNNEEIKGQVLEGQVNKGQDITAEVIEGHCDSDKVDCHEREPVFNSSCLRYDAEKFKNTPSLITFFPMGRLGNTISAYLTLMWLKIDHGLDVYLERSAFEKLEQFFENVGVGIKVLEDHICDWREFGFFNYEENVELLAGPEWKFGKAVNVHPDTEEVKKNKLQVARKFKNIYRKESREALRFKPSLAEYARQTLTEISDKIGKNPKEVTYVGIHSRRTDYLDFRKNVLGMKKLYKNYFFDAVDYFTEEFENVVFVYISDDMEWGRKKMRKVPNVFFVGCGASDDQDCIGKDFAVLGSCNHTVLTDGSFGFWASVIAGGEVFTEYGLIVPNAFVNP